MAQAIDLTGQRFGRLTALNRVGSTKSGAALWRLRCDCGGETTAHTGELRIGRRRSCSCGLSKPKHGTHNSRLHRIWCGMKQRCQNPNKGAFADYGGRGIVVCAEWQRFIPFMTWAMSNGYADHLEIDRIDNDGPYSPENCRWATRHDNMMNRRPSRPLGLRFTVRELETACQKAGVDRDLLFAHLPRKRSYR